ncbi:hypothetical protein ACFY2K_26180 [Kitasatospora sp. NPDC001309]|uniref:hypothetical protein n=1 Tax=Kitasatospora sp. NPDC001309 TaxID=3364013 RepID=UPI00368957A4
MANTASLMREAPSRAATTAGLMVRPSKRVECVDTASDEDRAKELWRMWAKLIVRAGWAKRFGVSYKHIGYGTYGIYLTDRSKEA